MTHRTPEKSTATPTHKHKTPSHSSPAAAAPRRRLTPFPKSKYRPRSMRRVLLASAQRNEHKTPQAATPIHPTTLSKTVVRKLQKNAQCTTHDIKALDNAAQELKRLMTEFKANTPEKSFTPSPARQKVFGADLTPSTHVIETEVSAPDAIACVTPPRRPTINFSQAADNAATADLPPETEEELDPQLANLHELHTTPKTFKPGNTRASLAEAPLELAWIQLILCNIHLRLKSDPCLQSTGLHDGRRHPQRVKFIETTLTRLSNVIKACRGTFSIDKFIEDSRKKKDSVAASATGAFSNMLSCLYIQIEAIYFSVAFFMQHSTAYTNSTRNRIHRLAIFNYVLEHLGNVRNQMRTISHFLMKKHLEVSVHEYYTALKKFDKTPSTQETYNKISRQLLRGILNPLSTEFNNFANNTLPFCKAISGRIAVRQIKAFADQLSHQATTINTKDFDPDELSALNDALNNFNDRFSNDVEPLTVPQLMTIPFNQAAYNNPLVVVMPALNTVATSGNPQTLTASAGKQRATYEELEESNTPGFRSSQV